MSAPYRRAPQVALYPNPVPQGQPLQLHLACGQSTRYWLLIQDVQGRELLRRPLWVSPEQATYPLPETAAYPVGVYLLQLLADSPTEPGYQFKWVVF